MVIYKLKARERKGVQQCAMVIKCEYHWRGLKNADFSHYSNVMNIEIYRINNEQQCYVAKTYHINLNKW